MLYTFYGTDSQKTRKKVRSVLHALFTKKPDASFFHIDADHWSQSRLEELVGGQGLFEQKYVVLLEDVFENEEAKIYILDILQEMAEAPHIFILQEEKIDKKTLTKIKKHAEKVQEFVAVTGKEQKKFNIFTLADSFASRNKREAWRRFIQAREAAAPEEIHGVLFFQAKALLLAKTHASANEAGLSPFPFQKAKQSVSKFTENELLTYLDNLVALYHESHRGKTNLDIGLEQFVLEK